MVSTMADDALRALAHPLRRDIVERLSGVATFGEVTRDGVSKPTTLEVFDALTCAEVMQRWFHARASGGFRRPPEEWPQEVGVALTAN
jgi:hypothetical protein